MNQDLNIFNFLSRYYKRRLIVLIILIVASLVSFAHYKFQKNEITLILKFDKSVDSDFLLLKDLKNELGMLEQNDVKFNYIESLSNFLVQNNFVKKEEIALFTYDLNHVSNFPVTLAIKIKKENLEKITTDYINIFISEYKKSFYESEIEKISVVNRNFLRDVKYFENLIKEIREYSNISKDEDSIIDLDTSVNFYFSRIKDLAIEATKLKNKLSISNEIFDLLDNINKKQNNNLIMATYKVNNYNLSFLTLFFVYIFIALVLSIFLVAFITAYEDYKKVDK
jgi:hypothetical protein